MRDAFHLSRPGGDPGPAGKFLLASRELGQRPTRQWRSSFAAAAEVLGVPHDEALEEALEAAEACAAAARPAPFAAARVFALARRALTVGRRAPVAWRPGRGGRAAGGLARRRRARAAAELAVRPPLARRGIVPGRRAAAGDVENPADGAETTRVVFAYAKAAAGAVDLAGDLARRAEKLRRPRPNCAPRGQGPRCGRCSTRIASPHRQKLAGNCRSAARGGCSTGWLRSARSGN